jgi:hypothetical protein
MPNSESLSSPQLVQFQMAMVSLPGSRQDSRAVVAHARERAMNRGANRRKVASP